MRVVVLTDSLFASRERSLLTRLEVGLADEGVRIIHAIPRGFHSTGHAGESLFLRTVSYAEHGLPWSTTWRTAKLRKQIRAMEELDEDDPIDVVHVFGGSVWEMGAELARQTGAQLAVEVWRRGQVERARSLKFAGANGHGAPVFMAPDAGIERALLAEGPGLAVRLTPWGVLTPAEAKPRLVAGKVPSVMIVGTGLDATAFAAALRGLAEAAAARPDLLIFIDALAARRAGVWALCRKLNLWSNLSLIDELESRRDLLIQGDLLVLPEAQGEQKSVVLEAMASGMVVAAAEDRYCSYLKDGETAALAPEGDVAAWTRMLTTLLSDEIGARRLSESARTFTRAERKASTHVQAVLGAYQWMGSGTIQIGAGRAL